MRVIIGEDSALFREGLAGLLLDAGHDVVAKAADATSLEDAVGPGGHDPGCDVVIIDVRMPPDLLDDGARAARRIRMRHPDLGILLLSSSGRNDPVATLTPREREVLALMAEGRTNTGIAKRLWLTPRTVETHVSNVLAKLGLTESEDDHRRVLAVLAHLRSQSSPT